METHNADYIKKINRFKIIKTLCRQDDINRNLIAQSIGLTGAAVTKIVSSLIQEGYLLETARFSEKRQRKARYLTIRDDTYQAVVCYIGRHSLTSAIIDISGRIIFSRDYFFHYSLNQQKLLQEILEDTIAMVNDMKFSLGIVLITPGIPIVDKSLRKEAGQSGEPFFWETMALKKFIRDTFSQPVYIENDSNAALAGELWFGKGRDSENVVLYSIGKGIGAAVYQNGQIMRGKNGNSVEIGHVTIDFKGPQCQCGNNGCLELYAGIDTLLAQLPKHNGILADESDLVHLFIRAANGDKQCLKVVRNYAAIVSEGAIILYNMFLPDKIILTNNEAHYIDLSYITDFINENISKRVYSLAREIAPVEVSSRKKEAFLLGGMIFALEKALIC